MSIKLKSAFVLIFSGVFFLPAFSQGMSATYHLADDLRNNQQYEDALFHYQRVLYFSEGPFREACHLGIAECYANAGNIEKSLQHYDQAYYHANTDSQANEIMLSKASANLLNGRYTHAMIDLYNVHPSDSSMQSRLHFYTGIAFFGNGQYDSAQVRFRKVLPADDTLGRRSIDSLFELNEKYHRLNPKTARIMSMIIPGSGQLYAGNVKEALNSFTITFGFAYLAINTSVRISIVDGLISVFPWFFRYYMGGYNNAAEIAKKKTKEREAQIYQSIMKVFRNSSAGERP